MRVAVAGAGIFGLTAAICELMLEILPNAPSSEHCMP